MSNNSEIAYFSHPSISNSDIGNFIYGGINFYQRMKDKVLKRKQTDYFDLGQALHCYLFEPEEFLGRYITLTKKATGLMKTFIENVLVLESTVSGQDELEIYRLAYEASGYKLAFDTVLKQFRDPENQSAYKEMKNAIGKTILNISQLEAIKKMQASLVQYKHIAKYLLPPKDIEVFNELEIYWISEFVVKNDLFDDVYGIECKSKLDRVLLDHSLKTATIVDLKTTSRPIKQFISSYRTYQYYRQCAFYRNALSYWLGEYNGGLFKDYEILNKIIVVRSEDPYDGKIFRPSENDLMLGELEYTNALKDLDWYVRNNIWIDKDTLEGTEVELNIESDGSRDVGSEEENAGVGGQAGL
jgi:hypothetical protein